MGFLIDLTGRRFARLRVTHRFLPAREYANKQALWMCLCDCGGTAIVASAHLRNGHTQSCGCWCRDKSSEANKTHGQSRTAEYIAWNNMIQRCTNSRHRQYKDYGGRGVAICDRWRKSPTAFLEDMGKKPSPLHTLERRDNDGSYEPINCYWATRTEQAYNRRQKSA